MCAKAIKKAFGSGSTKEQPTPAVAQSTPSGVGAVSSMMTTGETNTSAKGKKKLVINKPGAVGTGVNL